VVTGASGYVAGVLVDLLLKKGYRVRGTVRSLQDDNKVRHLKSDFPGLQLYEADLTKPGSFKAALEGVEIVFHTASPFLAKVSDPQKELVEPAVNGTIEVVQTALSQPTVRRIVLTSSVACVRRPDKEAQGFTVATDKDWNTFATIDNLPYPYSKVQAEKKAWEMVGKHNAEHPEHQVRLVAVLPSWVMGPPVGSRVDSVSVGQVVSWMDESQVETGTRNQLVCCVDVRDVAKAHVEAAERDNAHGRYICSHPNTTNPLEQVEMLKKLSAHTTCYAALSPSLRFATQHFCCCCAVCRV
jgi:nucleoside-diphosphate-sugar epimerase